MDNAPVNRALAVENYKQRWKQNNLHGVASTVPIFEYNKTYLGLHQETVTKICGKYCKQEWSWKSWKKIELDFMRKLYHFIPDQQVKMNSQLTNFEVISNLDSSFV